MFCLDPACSGLILVGYLVLMQTTQPTQGPDQTEHTVIPLIQHSLLNNLQMELSVMTGLSHSSVCVCVCVCVCAGLLLRSTHEQQQEMKDCDLCPLRDWKWDEAWKIGLVLTTRCTKLRPRAFASI